VPHQSSLLPTPSPFFLPQLHQPLPPPVHLELFFLRVQVDLGALVALAESLHRTQELLCLKEGFQVDLEVLVVVVEVLVEEVRLDRVEGEEALHLLCTPVSPSQLLLMCLAQKNIKPLPPKRKVLNLTRTIDKNC
jgi:hypothetical protein